MLTYVQVAFVGIIPLLVLTMVILSHFVAKRKKRGYSLVLTGNLILLVSLLLKGMLWISDSHVAGVLAEHVYYMLHTIGWYFWTLGLVQLFRVIPHKTRLILIILSAVWIPLGLISVWIPGVVIFVTYGLCAYFINKWLGYSGQGPRAVFSLLAMKGLLKVIQVMSSEKVASISIQWVDILLSYVVICITLVVVLGRVTEVLDKSYRDSNMDTLTGLYNRRYFTRMLNRYVEREIGVSVVFIDLDSFKKLNDTQGHEAGDNALKSVASILQEEVENKGYAGRYGGEEMVMLVTKSGVDMEEFAEKVRYRIENESLK